MLMSFLWVVTANPHAILRTMVSFEQQNHWIIVVHQIYVTFVSTGIGVSFLFLL